MLVQLLPIRHQAPLGPRKLFKFRFKPIREKITPQALKNYIRHTTLSAYRVMILWCALVWCPFRLLMKTRCCTTCRIFNWDHLTMFTPMLYLNGFYPRSL